MLVDVLICVGPVGWWNTITRMVAVVNIVAKRVFASIISNIDKVAYFTLTSMAQTGSGGFRNCRTRR